MDAAAQTDIEEIFEALGRAKVRYVVVGGVAVVLQGHPRLTADLDLVVALDPVNARRAMDALGALGYQPRAAVKAEDFADPAIRKTWIEEKSMMVFSLWSPRFPVTEVDVFAAEPMPFDGMWDNASRVLLGTTAVAVASIEDLIAMKKRVGRPKDLEDVVELEKLLAERERKP